MVKTLLPPETTIRDGNHYVPNGGLVPRLSGDLRPLIPKLGLREYWYPALRRQPREEEPPDAHLDAR